MSQEELEELEKELDETLGDFDEQMQREQTYAEERANDNASQESLGGVGTFEDYEEESEETAAGSSSQSSSSSQGSSEGSAEAAASSDSSEAGASGTAKTTRKGSNPQRSDEEESEADEPSDIPSGHDDDIVARQIREMAENETDPEMQERFWEEYRKYKNQ